MSVLNQRSGLEVQDMCSPRAQPEFHAPLCGAEIKTAFPSPERFTLPSQRRHRTTTSCRLHLRSARPSITPSVLDTICHAHAAAGHGCPSPYSIPACPAPHRAIKAQTRISTKRASDLTASQQCGTCISYRGCLTVRTPSHDVRAPVSRERVKRACSRWTLTCQKLPAGRSSE